MTLDPPLPPPDLASIGDRFWGLVLDYLVLLPLTIVSFVVHRHHSHLELVTRAGHVPYHRRRLDAVPIWETLLIAIPGFLYLTLTIGLRGRTLGQQARRIRVVRLADGGEPGYGRSVVRWSVIAAPSLMLSLLAFGRPASLIASLWVFIALAWMFWDGKRQGLHDKVAGVLVVNDRR